jgi:hypothetical protein
MAEQSQLLYSYTELAEILVKQAGIHSGHWMVFMRFGIGGANVPIENRGNQFFPTAVVPVIELGIQKSPEPTPLTVDASVVNPKKKTRQAGKKKTAGK